MRIKRLIDEIYTAHLEFGYRRVCIWLNKNEKMGINHKAVYRHMREMGIQAIYPRQNVSKTTPENLVYPYLLKGLTIQRPNQVWSIDITYIPICTDWLYLVAIIDWYSRYVLASGLFLKAGAKISMDHRGRTYDNIFIERLWRIVKYEDVYLNNYERPRDAREGLNRYLWYYNYERYHSSLNDQTPAEVFFKT